ncbi:MAG: CRISPR-associated endonuclease Cas1 [Candidatus Margulisbacteria bacterium]|nr:CRISPR-associated endonuclease Cas1 [Candidatus Margulisiibacteriota bacterium]
MPTLYLMNKDSVLGIEGDCFKVTSADGLKTTIPMLKVDAVVAFGDTQITTQAIAELLERDIPTTFLSNHGKYYGRLVSTETRNIELRIEQYKKFGDTAFRILVSRGFVQGKILNGVYLLKNLNRYRKIEGVQKNIEDMLCSVKKLDQVQSLDSLRGYEGSASAAYFKALPFMLNESFGFSERNRRPPRDPINSMLSFSYTLLMYSVYSAVSVVGLDPGIGFFHEYTNNRPALPLDLMEEFRAILADQVVIDLINHDMVSNDDFHIGEDKDRPVFINNDLRQKIIKKYEKRLATVILYDNEQASYRRVLELQARQLARCIKNNEAYKPFIQQ